MHQQDPSILLTFVCSKCGWRAYEEWNKQFHFKAFSNSAPMFRSILPQTERMYFLNSLSQTPKNSSVCQQHADLVRKLTPLIPLPFFYFISLIALLCFCCVLLTTGHDLSVDTECSTISIIIIIVLISSGVVSSGLYPVGTWHNKLKKYLLKGAFTQQSANLKPTLDWTSLKGNSKYSVTWVTRWIKRKPLMQHTQFTDLDRRQRLFVPHF